MIPVIDYESLVVRMDGCKLPLHIEGDRRVHVSNLGLKKFRRLLHKESKRNDFIVFGFVENYFVLNHF